MTRFAPSSSASQNEPMKKMPQMQAKTPPDPKDSANTKELNSEEISKLPNSPPEVTEDPVQRPLVAKFATENPEATSVITFLFSSAAHPFIAFIYLVKMTYNAGYFKVEWVDACKPSQSCWAPSKMWRVSNHFFSMVFSKRATETAQYYEHGEVHPFVKMAFIFAVVVPLLEWRVLPAVRLALLWLAEKLLEDLAKMDEESKKSPKQKQRDKALKVAAKLVEELQELEYMEDSDSDGDSDTDYDSCDDYEDVYDSDDSDEADDSDDSDEEDYIENGDLVCVGQRGKGDDVELNKTLRLVVDMAKNMQGRVSTKKI